MATSADLLLDTSAAVPFLLTDHEAHPSTFEALRGRRLGLAGHAAFETYSILTRLPDRARLSPQVAARLLQHNFPHTAQLGAARSAKLMAGLAGRAISGGAVYDALVAAVALEHGRVLASRDRRALATYASIGAEVLYLD